MFRPTYFAEKVTDINMKFLASINIKGIVLDVDDTLVAHEMPTAQSEVVEWINNLKLNNIKIILLSNNIESRVKPFAEKLDLPYISMGLKPFTKGLKRAIENISCKPENVLMVGDQVFTDILVANLMKVRSVLVDPIKKGETLLFKIKRALESPIRKSMISNPKSNLKEIINKLNSDSSRKEQ